jgi:hypothetical protein
MLDYSAGYFLNIEKVNKMKIVLWIILALFFSCIICLKASGETQNTFTINKPAITIIQELANNVDKPSFTIPPDAVKALELADVKSLLYARPKYHYYTLEIELVKPINKVISLNKRLEIWAEKDRTIFKSSIDIDYGRTFGFPLRWVNCVKEKVISKVEKDILRFEENKIRKIAE